MNQDQVLQRLKDGNARFVANNLNGELADDSRRSELVSGQAPWAIVLSCADSRVVPELAFDTGLGELFVLRVAGNIANTDTIASIEYAVAHLGTGVIVVMGHESCGAVGAALAGGDNGYNLNHLLAQIEPAKAQAGSDDVNVVVKKNAELSAKDLVDRSDIIKNAVDGGKLKIVSAFYNLGSGQVDFL
ncbi:carbonic anhydrase [Ekhidna lutea]|uniref:Carbonic anhydrase n=1 Tax=Ekhidna lutea TaxID=447679 RepID=A0A239GM27_EKHLU|nr:carbonic anhydrase [Ekhidna lutea]SNS69872.1 carbonic anhydrase [Ekhidna lutea]